MKDIILAISGRPGLYKLIAQGHNNLIVENITDHKRMPIGTRYSVTAINDISMYSEEGDIELTTVLDNLNKAYHGKTIDINYKSATDEELRTIMKQGLPNYDQDMVRISDMRKLLQWYNLLIEAGITSFVEEDNGQTENEKEQE